ncbi:MAG: HAD-IA family hydrolase [bacterium]|nr:HAD-IA family hydrolase [bacterium]
MNKRVIIFDFDGTIADTMPHIMRIINEHAHEFGYAPFSSTDIERLRGMTLKELIKELKVPFYKLPFFIKKIKDLLNKDMPDVKIFPGMSEVLHELKKRGYILGILSSNSKENIEKFLIKNNLMIFDFIHSEKNIFGKDKSLNNLIKKNNFKKDEVVYVGDEVRDIEACRKIGLDIISVAWGFNTPELLMKYNKNIINTPSQLLSSHSITPLKH